MLPDMSAKVSFLQRKLSPTELKSRLAASRSALIYRNGRTFAYLLEGNRVRETPVRVGETFGDMVEILSGLKAGDRVVVNPPKGLKDGSRIKVAER
jgi:multidrug efflux pump subunit AcrA (membrane-fusion protein)